MKSNLLLIGLIAVGCLGSGAAVRAGVRIKDITELEGARTNTIFGFGLVVGLRGTGDKSGVTQKAAVDLLQRFHIGSQIFAEGKGSPLYKSNNISLVYVSAELGPYDRCDQPIDATVSVYDDATSLFGGQLITAPLKGHDGVVYALAHGSLMAGGVSTTASGGSGDGAASATVVKNHPTSVRLIQGARVVREARGNPVCNGQLRLILRNPDAVTAREIAKAINKRHPNSALAIDAGAVQVFLPEEYVHQAVVFLSDIGKLEVNVDTTAKVIINERTGTIIAGEHVKISRAAIVHGTLAFNISNVPTATQQLPYGRGKTTFEQKPQVGVTEQGGVMQVIEPTVTVGELARALNALGATPREMMLIFDNIRTAGGLHAELRMQ